MFEEAYTARDASQATGGRWFAVYWSELPAEVEHAAEILGQAARNDDYFGSDVESELDVQSELYDSSTEDIASAAVLQISRFIETDVSHTRGSIVVRLNKLIDWFIEAGDDPDNVLDLDSLRGLLRFLAKTRIERLPQIGITGNGTFTAEWRADRDQQLVLNFISDADARYSLIAPDPIFVERRASHAGGASIEALHKILAGAGVRE